MPDPSRRKVATGVVRQTASIEENTSQRKKPAGQAPLAGENAPYSELKKMTERHSKNVSRSFIYSDYHPKIRQKKQADFQ
ncbi:hypothetical protein VRC02_03915 [Erwinia sp. E_sp_B01_3]|uniref:hypothetical protein n=1 Tax=unclassified Erwinia TaxID=2622719 RepID=UPI0030CF934D